MVIKTKTSLPWYLVYIYVSNYLAINFMLVLQESFYNLQIKKSGHKRPGSPKSSPLLGTNFFCIIKFICLPESFNTNISQKLFDYTITLVNSQHKNIRKKVILNSKTGFRRSF